MPLPSNNSQISIDSSRLQHAVAAAEAAVRATGTLLFIDPEWDLVFVFLTNQWNIQGAAPSKVLNAVYGALRHS